MQRVTQKDIAERLGVSRSTVREVLAGNPHVAEKTRQRVLEVVRELNYSPDAAAQALIRRRQPHRGFHVTHGAVGCVCFGEERLPYWTHLLRGVHVAAEQAGQAVLLLSERAGAGWEKVDGVLVHGEPGIMAERSLPVDLPLVSLMVEQPGHTSVVADDYAGATAAVQHLIDIGHRRIAYLVETDPTRLMAQARLKAYHDTLAAAGITADPRWVWPLQVAHFGADFLDESRKYMEAWLGAGWASLGCTALLAQNDRTAMGAMQALQAAGLRVPDDVSVVGFDNTDECRLATPQLTSVEVPIEAIGMRATDLLLRHLRGEQSTPTTVVLPTHLTVRASTAAPRAQ